MDSSTRTLTSLTLNSSGCDEELFECCRLSFSFDSEDKRYFWMIKLMPTDPDLREIVLRHDLFKKELRLHQEVVPKLQDFVGKKRGISLLLPLSYNFKWLILAIWCR